MYANIGVNNSSEKLRTKQKHCDWSLILKENLEYGFSKVGC
jgi:hypothetical protein